MCKKTFFLISLLLVFVLTAAVGYADRYIPSGFPDATNTGLTGVGLTEEDLDDYTGSMTITTNGTTIEQKHISGVLYIQANNVTIKKCLFTDGGWYGIGAWFGNTGLLVEDCTIVGPTGFEGENKGINGSNFTLRRCNNYNWGDAVAFGGNCTIEDCYFHDLNMYEGSHNDGMQMGDGDGSVVKHNTILGPWQDQTSAILAKTDFGPIDDLLIDNNFLSGGAYTLYLRDGGSGAPTNVTVQYNIFEEDSHYYGHLSVDGTPTYLCNVWDDGDPIPENSACGGDTTAPSPDPMTWSTDPYATGSSSISMTATTATDSSGVEYYFDCTAGGGSDSGWQDSTTYVDTGLSASTQYTYRVKARDKSSNHNETAYSTTKSATTDSASGSHIDATFDSDADGFTYADITNGSYVDGTWDGSYGYSGGGIRVRVAPGPTGGATDGQYSDGFSLSSAGWVTITLRYRLEMGEGFESDEYGEAYLMIDSTRYGDGTGDSLVRIVGNGNGGGTDDSGWLSGEFDASLSSGSHTIKVGAYNNASTAADEWVNAYFDNIEVEDTNAPDTTAPSPDPMTWATDPYATGSTSISMTATTATDTSGVEYYFECTAGGGHDSGWQDSTTYTDTGLSELTQYTYQVKARDKSSNQNETAYSTTKSATTQDGTAPSPDPMTFATDPYATGTTSISMTATTATDASGVEYYFDCTAGGGNDSGWQDSATYEDTGLSAETQYTYRVQARDKSSNLNATGYSTSKSATTDSEAATLVSWWELDESSGTTASDSSGNNHDGTLSGGSWAPTSGKFDGAVDLGDANDHVEVPATGMSASAGTISLWARIVGTQSGTRYFFGHTSTTGWADRIQLYMDNSDNQLDMGLGDTHEKSLNIMTLSANTWYHITLTWDSGDYVVYVDGISKASGTYTGLSSLGSIADIGNTGNSTYRVEAFQGLLDEVCIYDQALSKYDVADLAGITIASSPSPADNATDVSTTADLSWSAGYYAADVNGHDVYFGTDFNSVADANHSSAEFKGTQSSTTYDPGTLTASTAYYWAIDEINDTNTWAGDVWNFTTQSQDTTAPSPDPMTWATEPYATGATSISMTATTATDVSGVEYFFDCTTAGGHDSDWQDSATYEDTALGSETQYSYKVQARDKSANHNATAFSTTKSATTDFDPNLVSLWRLDESSGTTAADSSGNSHDGTLSGGSWAPTSGKIDGAVDIGDANSDRVQVPTTGMSASVGTIALWGRMEGTQSETRYFFGHTSTSSPSNWADRIQIYMDNSDNQLDFGLGDTHTKDTNIATLSANTWYHIALTWDGTNYIVYIDGDNDANGTYSGLSTLNSIADIGNTGNTEYRIEAFQGLLDDVRFYDEVLLQSEVQDLAGE